MYKGLHKKTQSGVRMKVLLTQPLSDYVAQAPRLPDLGLGHIASALLERHEVRVWDWNRRGGAAAFEAALREFSPDVCGLKVFTKDVAAALKTIALIRRTLPQTTIILGGPHPSCSEPGELMPQFPDCEYAFRGEVEHVLPDFLDALRDGGDVSATPGLIWREDGAVRCNEPTFIKDLDALRDPAWDLIDPRTYAPARPGQGNGRRAAAPIVTTRGCPGRCTFCSAYRANGRVIRRRGPGRVVDEMERLSRDYGVSIFHVMDNCFTSEATHLKEFCQEIMRRNLRLEWDCNSFERLDNLDGPHLEMMSRAGCARLHMGVESAAAETRRSINKKADFAEYERVMREARRAGLATTGWFILGFPGESRAAMRETVRRAYALPADELTFTPCFPLPGSEVYGQWAGRHHVDRVDWAAYDLARSPLPVSELPSRELIWLTRRARLGLKARRRSRALGALWARFVA